MIGKKKVLSIFSFIIAGLLLFYLIWNSYQDYKHYLNDYTREWNKFLDPSREHIPYTLPPYGLDNVMQDFVGNVQFYVAIAFIALGMFFRAGLKDEEEPKNLNDTQKKKVMSILSIVCFFIGLIFSFWPFWDSYKYYRFASVTHVFADVRFYFGISLILLGVGIFTWKRARRGHK